MTAIQSTRPVLILCMGVSGCGKSTLAQHLAQEFGITFLEADDFHSNENKAHMAAGKPLTDAMREPWIESMCNELKKHQQQGESCILAYSGLRRTHRQKFRALGYPTLFLHLAGAKEIIQQRIKSRANHFMPADLLNSQYLALDPAKDEDDMIELDISQAIPDIVNCASEYVKQFIAETPYPL